MSKPTRICFVCLGNIVRSPLAQNLFLHLAAEAGVEAHYFADSAGIIGYHAGEHPDPRMRAVAAQKGLVYDGRARQFTSQDFEKFDLIVPMDVDNYNELVAIAPNNQDKDKIHLLREFDPQGGCWYAIPDPYYGGLDGFEKVYAMVERSCRGLLENLEDTRNAGG